MHWLRGVALCTISVGLQVASRPVVDFVIAGAHGGQADRLPPGAFGVALAFVGQVLVQHAQGVLGMSR